MKAVFFIALQYLYQDRNSSTQKLLNFENVNADCYNIKATDVTIITNHLSGFSDEEFNLSSKTYLNLGNGNKCLRLCITVVSSGHWNLSNADLLAPTSFGWNRVGVYRRLRLLYVTAKYLIP